MPFVPHFLLRDMSAGTWPWNPGSTGGAVPLELGQKAKSLRIGAEGIKPEWYFLFMFQSLKKLPATSGIWSGWKGNGRGVVLWLLRIDRVDRSVPGLLVYRAAGLAGC